MPLLIVFSAGRRSGRKDHTASARRCRQVAPVKEAANNDTHQMLPARTLSVKEKFMPDSDNARIVLTTAADTDEANRLARTLVEERLVACATLIPSVRSIYRWEGEVETATESLLLLKTGADQLTALQNRLQALHSYQIPEFLVLPVERGSSSYLEWLQNGLRRV